jgi:hypothetical protein
MCRNWVWAAVLLQACGASGVSSPPANEPVPPPPPAALVEPSPTSEPVLPALPVDDERKLSLLGHVVLPDGVTGLANARDGVMSGAPVRVIDLLTGKQLGQGVTYYDGSFRAEVPALVGKRSVLLMAMLVDATSREELFPLQTVLQLQPELTEQIDLELGPGSTAWVALLQRIAAVQLDAPAPDWTRFTPGVIARALADMVANSDPLAPSTFLVFARADEGLRSAASPQALRQGIDRLVDGLISSATTVKN